MSAVIHSRLRKTVSWIHSSDSFNDPFQNFCYLTSVRGTSSGWKLHKTICENCAQSGHNCRQKWPLQDRLLYKQVEESPHCVTEALRAATGTGKRENDPFKTSKLCSFAVIRWYANWMKWSSSATPLSHHFHLPQLWTYFLWSEQRVLLVHNLSWIRDLQPQWWML